MVPETEPGPRSTVPWTPWVALGIWVLAFFGSALWVTVLAEVRGEALTSSAPPIWLFVGQFALWAAYGLGPLFVATQAGGALGETFRISFDARQLTLWGSAGIVLQLVVIPLIYIPLRSLIDTESVGDVAEGLIDTAGTTVDLLLLFIMIVVMAPLVEELFFRGFLLPSLLDRMGPLAAIALSSVWFAVSHLQPIQFPGLLAVGLALGYVRLRTGQLFPAIVMHMTFNAVTYGVLVSQL
jgi:membrane protease YdiL (CAAX protease family)